jgi:hypothetical protein
LIALGDISNNFYISLMHPPFFHLQMMEWTTVVHQCLESYTGARNTWVFIPVHGSCNGIATDV